MTVYEILTEGRAAKEQRQNNMDTRKLPVKVRVLILGTSYYDHACVNVVREHDCEFVCA